MTVPKPSASSPSYKRGANSMEPFSKRPRVEDKTAVPAEEAISFHLLKKNAQGQVVLEEDGQFPPEMTHQLFGEEEQIVGYDGLSIDIWFTPQFQAFIDVKYAGKGPRATELKQPFQDAFEAGFFQDKAQFDTALQEEAGIDVAALGRQVGIQETQEGTSFSVHHSQLATATPQLKALHARLQPLLYFFVDAASAIDQEDEGWHLLTAVERTPDGEVEVLGFATAYRHYHYPAGSRLKLAQILVLPPHQRRGVGGMLLEAAQALADELDACDLAFEDPAEALQALRTTLDVRRALALDWLQQAAATSIAALADAASKDKGKGNAAAAAEPAAAAAAGGSSKGRAAAAAALAQQHPLAAPAEVLNRMRKELRLSKLQAAVVWRVLLLVVGRQEGAVVEGVSGMIRQSIVAQQAAAKEDAQGKSVRETDKGFIMCRGAAASRDGGSSVGGSGRVPAGLPLLPVEEMSAEQQAEAVEEATEQQLEAAAAVAAKFLGGCGDGDEDSEGEGEEEGDE